jgi:hypothetical protein
MTANGGHEMALGTGRWTVERVGSRVRELAENVKQMADNLPRTQMPAVRMPPWVRRPEVKMAPAPRRGVHPLWVVAGAAVGAGLMYFFDREQGRRRREMVREKAEKAREYVRQTTEKVDGPARDMMSRARGLVVDLRSKVGAGERREPWAPETSSEARRS